MLFKVPVASPRAEFAGHGDPIFLGLVRELGVAALGRNLCPSVVSIGGLPSGKPVRATDRPTVMTGLVPVVIEKNRLRSINQVNNLEHSHSSGRFNCTGIEVAAVQVSSTNRLNATVDDARRNRRYADTLGWSPTNFSTNDTASAMRLHACA
jgi:hypothetical protein